MMTGRKKKRRDSTVFNFEQTEETLENNENIINLYKNKNYRHPDEIELEMLMEEVDEGKQSKRGRGNGSLVIGKERGKRLLNMDYKYWEQDDKERTRRRKTMIQKLWRGRKKPKISQLPEELEKKLMWLIEAKEISEEEDIDGDELYCVREDLKAKQMVMMPESCHDTSMKSRKCECEILDGIKYSLKENCVYDSYIDVKIEDNNSGQIIFPSLLEDCDERNQHSYDGTGDSSFVVGIKDINLVVDKKKTYSDNLSETIVRGEEVNESDASDMGNCETETSINNIHETPANLKGDDLVESLAAGIRVDTPTDMLKFEDFVFHSQCEGELKRQTIQTNVGMFRLMENQMHGSVFIKEETVTRKPAFTYNTRPDRDTKENEQVVPPMKVSSRRTKRRRPLDVLHVQMLEGFGKVTVEDTGQVVSVKSTEEFRVDDTELDSLIMSLMTNTRTPEGGNLWSCLRCSKVNRTKSHMVDHIEATHMSNTSRLCPHCGKIQKNRNCLRVHVSTYHRLERSVPPIQIDYMLASNIPNSTLPNGVPDISRQVEVTLEGGEEEVSVSSTRRRSSVLGFSYGGTDISLPPAVRRSWGVTPRHSLSLSVAGGNNDVLSDSEEDIVSGIFGGVTCGPRYNAEKNDHNKAFVL